MQVAVKWIYRSVKGPGGRPMDAGVKPALCFRGRKYMLCVVTEYPIRVIKRPVKDYDTGRDVVRAGGAPHSVEDALATLRGKAVSHGITVGAQTLLDRAQQGTELDEEQFNDEEQLMIENETVRMDATGKPIPADTTSAAVATDEGTQPKPKRKAVTKPPKEPKTTESSPPKAAATAKAKTTKTTKAAKTAKTAAPEKKAKGGAKTERGPSRISQMVEWMRGEVKKQGGQDNLERGYLKGMFAKAAEKFGLSVITASIQYGKQVRNKG